jgi:hypothetical protein
VPLAAVLGLVVGGGGDKPDRPAPRRQITAGSVSFLAPAGWRPGAGARIPGVAMRGAAGASAGDGVIVAGTTTGAGKTLLPTALSTGSPHGTPVRLGDLEAYRYERLRGLTVYVSPTSAGVATLACRGTDARTCGAAAATLRLDGVQPVPLGPHTAYAHALTAALGPLRRDRITAFRALAAAKGPRTQATAAARIAAAYRAAAARLAKAPVTPLEMTAHPALVNALRTARAEWQQLSAAARASRRARYAPLRGRVRAAERHVARATAALNELGYEGR